MPLGSYGRVRAHQLARHTPAASHPDTCPSPQLHRIPPRGQMSRIPQNTLATATTTTLFFSCVALQYFSGLSLKSSFPWHLICCIGYPTFNQDYFFVTHTTYTFSSSRINFLTKGLVCYLNLLHNSTGSNSFLLAYFTFLRISVPRRVFVPGVLWRGCCGCCARLYHLGLRP